MENLRGALLMVAAMAGFAVTDALIKTASGVMPTGQVLLALTLGSGLTFTLIMLLRRVPIRAEDLKHPMVIVRALCETFGALSFILAITLGDLSTASAILQATPLAMVAGAAIWLGEDVGWRRWAAVGLGFVGVLIVIRPGLEGFDPNSLLAFIGCLCLAARDLLTRRIPAHLPSLLLSATANVGTIPAALIILAIQGDGLVWPTAQGWSLLAAMLASGILAYWLVVTATRLGEISVIAPFRFSRIIFALVLAWAIFGERPDVWTYLGTALIVASSGFAIWRERVAAKRRTASLSDTGTL